jgi:hypothetical protein
MTRRSTPETIAEHYRATLTMHAGLVDAAENDLERARDGWRYWVADAVMRGVMTSAEVAQIVGEAVAEIERIVATEKRFNRHTGIR